MNAPKPLGEFELTVMAAVLHLGDGAYGAAISEEICTRTGRRPAVGAIYTTLARMQGKALVSSRVGEPEVARGGRPRRYFQITSEGVAVFRASVRSLKQMLDGIAL
ncbi:MAG: helix-turn-helix transcriptional regulator [Pseudomonadota bacterium]